MKYKEKDTIILVERLKLSLLRDIPIDELPNAQIQEIVRKYRDGTLTMIAALKEFEKIKNELCAMVRINIFINNMLVDEELVNW
jgi:hypothetical protein